MRIACPECSATYDVPDTMLSAGRSVRCGKCGHQWLPLETPVHHLTAALPQAASAVAPPPPRPAPPAHRLSEMLVPTPAASQRLTLEPVERILPPEPNRVEPPRRRRAPRAVWLGWVASIAVWASVIWAGYAYRAQVMDAWPPSQRLYAALGLGPGS